MRDTSRTRPSFSLTSLPRRLVVLGAGPIGCELAQAFARFGSQVTLIASHSNILAKEDADAAAVIETALRQDGVELLTNARATQVMREESQKQVWIERGERSTGTARVPADEILVAVGRVPNVDDLGLASAGIAFDSDVGVRVDDHFRTTNRTVFGAGDVCSRFQFTHAADAMARIVLQTLCFQDVAEARRW